MSQCVPSTSIIILKKERKKKKNFHQLGVMAHSCIPSTWDAEVGEYCKLETITRPCPKKKKKNPI
jgi:hypothetical protein